MEDKILTIDRIEDVFDDKGNLIGKQCFSGEDSVKVKNPKGARLKERWGELKVGLAYLFEMGEFTPPGKTEALPFVKDFKAVEGALPPPVTPAKVETPDDTTPPKVVAKAAYKPDSKNRAFALSYAKDYTIAKINKGEAQNVNDVVIVAEIFLQYLDGNITPDVVKVISSLNKR